MKVVTKNKKQMAKERIKIQHVWLPDSEKTSRARVCPGLHHHGYAVMTPVKGQKSLAG